jgi:hypothetical protein
MNENLKKVVRRNKYVSTKIISPKKYILWELQELQIIAVLQNETGDVPMHVTRQNLAVKQLIRTHHTQKHIKETVHVSMYITKQNTSVRLSMYVCMCVCMYICMYATNQTRRKDN